MSIFSKSNKKKIVLALACASILGDRTQAIKEPQSLQTVASVGGGLLLAIIIWFSKGLVKNGSWQ